MNNHMYCSCVSNTIQHKHFHWRIGNLQALCMDVNLIDDELLGIMTLRDSHQLKGILFCISSKRCKRLRICCLNIYSNLLQ